MPRLLKKESAPGRGATPKEVDRELRKFSRATRVLSSGRPRLIDEHPNQWVGIYDGKVQVAERSLHALVSRLKKQGLPLGETIIRYIDASGRRLIL